MLGRGGVHPGLFQFGAEHEGPIGAAACALGHGDADRRHLGTQQILAVTCASLPASHHVAERFLPRGHILRGDLGAIARARGAILGSRSARPVMADPASLGLILGLHRGGLGQARVEDHGASPILDPERVDRGKRGLGVERLHGSRSLLWRFEDNGAATDDARQAPFRDSRRSHHPDQGGHQETSLKHPLPSCVPFPCREPSPAMRLPEGIITVAPGSS